MFHLVAGFKTSESYIFSVDYFVDHGFTLRQKCRKIFCLKLGTRFHSHVSSAFIVKKMRNSHLLIFYLKKYIVCPTLNCVDNLLIIEDGNLVQCAMFCRFV